MIATILAWIGAAFGTVVLGVGVAAGYNRRPARNTLSLLSTAAFRRGDVLGVDVGRGDDLVIVRRVLDSRTLAVEPYTGWRKWADQLHKRWRVRYRALKDRIYDRFEKDDPEDDDAEPV